MKKKIIYWFVIIVVAIWFGFWYYFFSKNKQINEIAHDLNYYTNIWNNTFLNYQTTNFNIKNKWDYEFSVWFEIEGSGDVIKNDIIKKSWINLYWELNKISLKVLWNYDFSTWNSNLNWSIRIYLNKQELGLWDLDLSYNIVWDKLEYSINKLERLLLNFFSIDNETSDLLMNTFDDNKWKTLSMNLTQGTMQQIVSIFKSSSEKNPLYKNTDSEEKQIIKAFLDNKVLEIVKWVVNWNITKVEYKLNTDNFIIFMNNVANIIWDEKTFDTDKELFKNLVINWVFDIKNNLIINGSTNIELPLISINKETWKEQFQPIILIFDYKLPTPNYINFDLSTSVFSPNSKENKLKIIIKWIIK